MTLSLHTEICDMLGIEYPIFAFNHCRDVTAAVCNAGGIGVLGVTGMTFDEKRAEVEVVKETYRQALWAGPAFTTSQP